LVTTVKDGLKKLKDRIRVWLIALLALILVDEVVKEGYLFKFEDLFTLEFTHEKLFAVVAAILVVYEVYQNQKGGDHHKMKCANCGKEKDLLPNGLCSECAKIMAAKN